MKRRIEITFEVEERILLKTCKSLHSFCRQCGQTVEKISFEDAALFLSFSEIQFRSLAEKSGVHFDETEGKYICRNWLEKLYEFSQTNSGSKQ